MNDKTIIARAMQIAGAAKDPIQDLDAIAQAYAEVIKDLPTALRALASKLAPKASVVRKESYQINDGDQLTFFDRIPQVLGIRTPEGTLLFTKQNGTAEMVAQWNRESIQFHKSQLTLAQSLEVQISGLALDPKRGFAEQMKELGQADKTDDAVADDEE